MQRDEGLELALRCPTEFQIIKKDEKLGGKARVRNRKAITIECSLAALLGLRQGLSTTVNTMIGY